MGEKDDTTTCPEQYDEGRPDVLDAADPNAAVAGIRCCNDAGNDGDSFCGAICQLYTFDEAKARCEDEGMRLCTEAEVLAGAVVATGCEFGSDPQLI